MAVESLMEEQLTEPIVNGTVDSMVSQMNTADPVMYMYHRMYEHVRIKNPEMYECLMSKIDQVIEEHITKINQLIKDKSQNLELCKSPNLTRQEQSKCLHNSVVMGFEISILADTLYKIIRVKLPNSVYVRTHTKSFECKLFKSSLSVGNTRYYNDNNNQPIVLENIQMTYYCADQNKSYNIFITSGIKVDKIVYDSKIVYSHCSRKSAIASNDVLMQYSVIDSKIGKA